MLSSSYLGTDAGPVDNSNHSDPAVSFEWSGTSSTVSLETVAELECGSFLDGDERVSVDDSSCPIPNSCACPWEAARRRARDERRSFRGGGNDVREELEADSIRQRPLRSGRAVVLLFAFALASEVVMVVAVVVVVVVDALV